jgi:DNA-binding protein H-NS
MPSYKELKAKAEELLKQADEIRKSEIASIVADIKAKMTDFGITLADLRETGRRTTKKKGARRATKRASKGKKVAPKYRDPATGQAWSGRGKEPKWLAAYLKKGRKKESYLIK